MFMSSMIPFSSFLLPMTAGAMLAAVVIENGEKTAWLVYVSVSLLSLFIVADIDAKVLFISFFGYYSIIKPRLDLIPQKNRRVLLKLLILNATMVAGYFAALYLFGLNEAAEQSDLIGKYLPIFTLCGLNVTFLLYDYLLAKCIVLYHVRFRSVFLRK